MRCLRPSRRSRPGGARQPANRPVFLDVGMDLCAVRRPHVVREVIRIHDAAVVAMNGAAIHEKLAAAVRAQMPQRYQLRSLLGHLPQSSSASRFTAGACGFLLFIHWSERPEL
jgi:hypothetical protein